MSLWVVLGSGWGWRAGRAVPGPDACRSVAMQPFSSIITAFAANKGVSCSARPGCAGAKDDDDGDRGGGELEVSSSWDDEDEERELSSEAL